MNEKKIAKERGSATKRSKNMRLKTTGVPDELWKNYPELIILGPDQMEAIKCKKNKVALTGEPGCGKTFVLLALLFIHTAKCRDKLQFPGFKKTCFVIPDRKIEFRKYVSSFITDHCNEESVWTKLTQKPNFFYWMKFPSMMRMQLLPLIGFQNDTSEFIGL